MEKQEELKIGIGTIESEKTILPPKKVKIVGANVEDTAKAKKVVFLVKHLDKEEPIKISSVAHIVQDKVKITGTWLNLDKEGKLQKGSALVIFLQRIGASTVEDAIGKEVETKRDGDYLCFQAY